MTERLDHHRQSQHTQFAKCPLDLSFEGMRHPVAAQHAFVEIEAERLAADTRGRVARLAPQYRPDARKKFADFDRLEYAIVGTDVKAVHTRLQIVQCSENQHGDVIARGT